MPIQFFVHPRFLAMSVRPFPPKQTYAAASPVPQPFMDSEKVGSGSVKPSTSARRKSYKAKGKKNALLSRALNLEVPEAEAIHEDEWAWTILADSSVSKRPPVFTSDGKYVYYALALGCD